MGWVSPWGGKGGVDSSRCTQETQPFRVQGVAGSYKFTLLMNCVQGIPFGIVKSVSSGNLFPKRFCTGCFGIQAGFLLVTGPQYPTHPPPTRVFRELGPPPPSQRNLSLALP